MRVITGAIYVIGILTNVTVPTFAQGRPSGDSGYSKGISYDVAGGVSPSSATTTISPSSVPQAMDRMNIKDTILNLSLGTIYAEGKFGTDSKTTIWSSALGARLRYGDWTLSASLPWMQIRSRSTIFTGIDSTPVLVATNTSANKRTANGFGDLTIGGSYTVARASLPVEVQISGRAKINTATVKSGLSSGENDYALGTDVSLPLNKVTPFVSFTYRFLGNTTLYRLRNGPAASAGASYTLGRESALLVSYHYARAATRQVEDSHELFAGASTRVAATPLRLTGFATAGLSRGAAAVAGGLALSVGLGDRDHR